MRKITSSITLLLFTWLFVVIVPLHHHQATIGGSSHFDCSGCSTANYQTNQCQLCLISANKTIKPDAVSFDYHAEILATADLLSQTEPASFYPVLKINRAPPATV